MALVGTVRVAIGSLPSTTTCTLLAPRHIFADPVHINVSQPAWWLPYARLAAPRKSATAPCDAREGEGVRPLVFVCVQRFYR